MKAGTIIKILEQTYPTELAESWDNPGLQTGDRDWEVNHIYLALDATDQVICDAMESGAQMIITHHPMIFSPMKLINTDDFISRRVVTLLTNHMVYYAMHTNYDKVSMGELAAERLGLTHTEVFEETGIFLDQPTGFGKVGELPGEMTLEECGVLVKKAFQLPGIKVFGQLDTRVHRAAILPGSGKGAMEAAVKKGAQVVITGDIGHHEGIDAQMNGVAVIDAGHYGLEHIFVAHMAEYCRNHISGVKVTREPICHPFQVL